MAQMIKGDITVDEMIMILQGHSNAGRGGLPIDIVEMLGENLDPEYYNMVKIKISDMLTIYIEEQ